MGYSFSGSRYYSKGVKELLSAGLRSELWGMLDAHIRVSEVQVGIVRYRFVKKKHLDVDLQQVQMFVGDDQVTKKNLFSNITASEIWIIDEGEHVIMLLPKER